ncbi:uncharacterized protein [Periplaneta americana]|uniref:uncharacterized protein n=1 Tax=Periplaneta americana TaxID=6978 RepID=UPI0037E71609
MLADKTVSKKTTWEHVAAEMKKRGFIVGENAGEKCKREWNDIVSDYLNCHWTEACKVEADVPLYYDTLKEILNKKSVVLNSSDSSDEESTSDYTAETVQRKRKRTDYFSDVHNKFNRLPKQICQKDDSSSSELSPSDVTYSSDSNDNEAFETFKMLSETCTVNASTADDSKVSKSSSSREPNNEEVILVYPEGTTFSVDYRFLNDFMSSVDNVDTEEFVTVYPDDTENVTTSSARNHFIDHSYTEQISMEAVKPPNQSFVCSKKQGDLNIKPSSSDLEAHTKKSASATKKNLKSNKNLATIVVSPKPNQPARPIPTAGEAMMSLVLRLHEEEKRKEKARMRRREARISNLETMLEKQKTTQQDLLNKVLLVLNELN